MPERPRVSVVLTSHNHGKYLRAAIDSVLGQSFEDFELIIWDDASTDDSPEIIAGASDRRIRSFRNEVQKRGVWGLNRGIREVATGEYIAIHHSDDLWEPQKLEKQVAFLDAHPGTGAVFSRASIIRENGELLTSPSNAYFRIFDQPNRTRHEWLNHFFCRGNALCHPSAVIRRAVFDPDSPYRSGLGLLADLDLWVRLCLSQEIFILPEKLVRYRVRTDGANASVDPTTRIRRPFEFLQVLNNYRKISSPDELLRIFPTAGNYILPAGCDLGYALGRTALELRPYKVSELFGLTLLFEALNDPRRAARLDELYGFTNRDFVALNTEHDVFSIRDLDGQAARLEALSQKQTDLQQGTGGSRLSLPRRIRNFLVPPGSARAKAARTLLSPLVRAIRKAARKP